MAELTQRSEPVRSLLVIRDMSAVVKSDYHLRDIWQGPGLLSLARVPLAGAFVVVVEQPWTAFGVLCAAALTDVLDGWWARRSGRESAMGAAVDPITDKIFVIAVAVALLVTNRLTLLALALLSIREVAELPLLAWRLPHRRVRCAIASAPHAERAGKLATVLQFLSVTLALFRSPYTLVAAGATGGAGVVAAVAYWRRELRLAREPMGELLASPQLR
jgi:phosphatidylglycerophosphate synthase